MIAKEFTTYIIRHTRESGNLEPQGHQRSPWTPAFAGVTDTK
jgi:hypothetical protein